MARPSLEDDPKHWRQLAEDARATAEQLGDPGAKKTMLDIAEGYEQLAAIAETRMAAKQSK
jgi:hypothetical protein